MTGYDPYGCELQEVLDGSLRRERPARQGIASVYTHKPPSSFQESGWKLPVGPQCGKLDPDFSFPSSHRPSGHWAKDRVWRSVPVI